MQIFIRVVDEQALNCAFVAVYADLFVAEYDEIVAVGDAFAVWLQGIEIKLVLVDIEEEGCLILFETRRIFGILGVERKRTEATEYSSRFGLADNKNIFFEVYYFMEPIADRRASI